MHIIFSCTHLFVLSSFCIVWFRILDERSAWLTSSPATLLYLCHNEVLNFLSRIWDRTHEANNKQGFRMKSIWICIYAWVDNFFFLTSLCLPFKFAHLCISFIWYSCKYTTRGRAGESERETTAVVQCLLAALNAKQLQQNHTHKNNIRNKKKKKMKISSEQETPKQHKYLNIGTVFAMHYGWTDSVYKNVFIYWMMKSQCFWLSYKICIFIINSSILTQRKRNNTEFIVRLLVSHSLTKIRNVFLVLVLFLFFALCFSIAIRQCLAFRSHWIQITSFVSCCCCFFGET